MVTRASTDSERENLAPSSALARTELDDLPGTERELAKSPNHPKSLQPQKITLRLDDYLHPDAPPVSSLLYSGFIEHIGRCIYGGVADDPAAPSPKSLLVDQGNFPALSTETKGDKPRLGLRKDVLKVLSRQGDLECPMMRWPGGNFVSNYHWKDGIGAYEHRKRRRELAWATIESNLFGTDEFIDWCRAADVEPYICINMGTGTLEEALDWLEYCNGTGDTYWANKRRENTGRNEPHNVKLWGLGNEMWGEWQVGHLTAGQYAEKANRWAHALKLLDPSIRLVSCGRDGTSDWDREVVQKCLSIVDLHSIHLYTVINYRQNPDVKGLEYEVNVFGPAAAERTIQNCKSLIDLANVGRMDRGEAARDVKICFDEWNTWDPVLAKPTEGNEQHYTYLDMLGFCAWLNVLVRQSKDCPVACLAQSVNDIAPIIAEPDRMLYQSIYWPLKLFARNMKGGKVLTIPSFRDTYGGPAHPAWIQHLNLRPKYIDAVAMSVSSSGGKTSIRISILNRHPSANWEAALEIENFDIQKVEIHEMYSDKLDALNTWEEPDLIQPVVTELSGDEWKKNGGKRAIRKHSWTFIMLDGVTK